VVDNLDALQKYWTISMSELDEIMKQASDDLIEQSLKIGLDPLITKAVPVLSTILDSYGILNKWKQTLPRVASIQAGIYTLNI
jgi:hypothetical protein